MIHSSDLEKILDVVARAVQFHMSRDEMNAALHLAQTVRYSPLTTELDAARQRLVAIREVLREAEEAKAGA